MGNGPNNAGNASSGGNAGNDGGTSATPARPRCGVLVGSYSSGKTSLLEALLFAAGARSRKGKVTDGSSLGDASIEARARQMSIEPNVATCTYLGDPWHFIDCPGSIELAQDARNALMAADVAIVVAEPEPARAITLAPLLKFLDDYQIPHCLFVNKMDKANARVRDVLEALQTVSSRPLLLRQVPIRDGEQIVGAVDLVSERAWKYQEHKPSALIAMPETVKTREEEARREMLEALADFDDGLLEELLEDKVPPTEEVYAQLTKDLADDLIVPVFLGSADLDNGITRLWKALRHETPDVASTAARLGIADAKDFTATVVKTFHLPHTGKVSLARLWQGEIKEGVLIGGERLAGLISLNGGQIDKLAEADAGALVGLVRLEALQTGDLVTGEGRQEGVNMLWPEALTPVFAQALQPLKREDEVKLTASLAKLIEEDPSLSLERRADTHELVLLGQGQIHLQIAADKLKNRHHVEVAVSQPQPAYKETIRKSVEHHARHKRQSGGHGQFADIKVRIEPLERGAGILFDETIVGGSVPRQYIPAVENGVREAAAKGPLGFPVVDFKVTLHDGQFHSVDSSEMAFKIAGRLAVVEGLPECEPVLLEPIYHVTIQVPSEFTNKVHGLISSRRGQILGFDARAGWTAWDQVEAYMPHAELQDLIVDLRSLTLGVGSYTARFDHLQELHGRMADQVVAEREQAA